MEKLEKLTPEQEIKMIEIKNFWLDFIFSCKNQTNKEQAKKGIDFIYSLVNLKPPQIIFVDSPMACQIENAKLAGSDKPKYEEFSYYGNIGDYGWVAFYDFFTAIGILNNKKFNNFKELLLSGIYDMIQMENVCIVSNMPDRIERNEAGNLHCENASAIHWRDGFELFYWNGINVPEKWIKNKSELTKKDINNETNAEKRRCLQEIIGSKRYAELLEIEVIDTDKDLQGFTMNLFRTKEPDAITKEHIFFYNCICPSTGREYYLCVKPCTNVWAAKAQGFEDKPIAVRHGDIGLLNLNKSFKNPIYES